MHVQIGGRVHGCVLSISEHVAAIDTVCNNSYLCMFLSHLVGLVVKASASRAEDSGFESDFFGVESYQ